LGKQWGGGVWVGTNSTVPNINGMRKDVIQAFKECGVGAIEWPGGCAANGYKWAANKNPSNDVGTDRFMQFCDSIGAEPIIAGPSEASAAADNKAWVEYLNNNPAHPEWNVKYFKIGNEVWGCGGNQNVTTYISNYTANYNVLSAPVNGKKLFLIAGSDLQGRWGWVTTMLNAIGTTIDGIELHDYVYFPDTYPSANPTTAQYWDVVNHANALQIKPHLDNGFIPPMNAYDPGKRIKVVEDEWGDWLMDTGDGWMQQNNIMDALSAGEQLHLFMQRADRMQIACIAQGVNVIQSLVNIDTKGVMAKTPNFYVFKLFIPHHVNNAKVAPITASSIQTVTGGGATMPALTAFASVDSIGIVNISFTNVDLTATRAATVALTSGKASYTVLSAEVVTGEAYTSFNDFGASEAVNIKPLAAANYSVTGKSLSVTLPTKSVVMIRLAPPGITGLRKGRFPQGGTGAFSIQAGPRGSVIVTSSSNRKTPVTIALYDMDGRTLLSKTRKTFGIGNGAYVLETGAADGLFLVKITGPGISLSKQVAIAK
ncbi:MAG: alpha-L-arabinofuranosidase C-terminal domain-containing protein, partial [Fibrobacteria bacterium]